ncbi:MAG: TonB-dependent receptor [Bacteroidetes bacterium]|nr:TonB-dependent receptor [Bacteroidota bacterium]
MNPFCTRFFAILLTSTASLCLAQTQTVRGFVRDKESQQQIVLASIVLVTNNNTPVSAVTDSAGQFILTGIPLGRQDFAVSAPGYLGTVLPNIVVTSGKEVILNIELEADYRKLEEAVVKAKNQPGKVINENALVSARLFTVDETDRFAGSRGDPARMASNFAGVQGADDSRNDIVVRGNSPQGILWRLEGIDIPNPNHFSIPGTSGGPVSIINNKILANSDFFTGAFPAEYGNSTAGVFDLRMRNGNNRRHEFSSQLGFLGWDAMAEGPFSKKSKASYLFTYRYSTLALFSALKIPIGTDAVPQYQDASLKINIPIGKKANLAFFGIGGGSRIAILISKQKESSANLYGDQDRDQTFGSGMAVAGTHFTYNINSRSYIKAIAAFSHQQVNAHHELVFRHITGTIARKGEVFNQYALDSLVPNLYYTFRTNTAGIHLFYNTRISARTSFRCGVQASESFYSFQDSNRNFDFIDTAKYWKWFTRWNSKGTGLLMQPYFQFRFRLAPKVTLSAGYTGMVFALADNLEKGKSYVSWDGLMPRAGLRYQLNPKHAINLGLGRHSQIQPAYTYFYILPGNTRPHNMGMGMTKSTHAILGWDWQIKKDLRSKIETYYQSLDNIPVELHSSSFSLANTGSGFSRFFPDSLQNTGTGFNYGIEFTLEKFFTRGYYYLATLSLFDAKYKGSDGVSRSTDFNTRYAMNALVAKEWNFNKKNALNVGGKITLAGARLTSPMDTLASRREREYVGIDALKNSVQFGSNYARFDIRIAYRINGKKVTHELALDLVNITNRKNILKYSYISEAPYNRQTYQLGFLPLFYYKLDFGL